MKVNVKNFTDFSSTADMGHVVYAEVDGQEHTLFRRTQMPVSGGTHTPPHVVVREIADDYTLYKEAEEELKNAGEDGEYTHTATSGGQAQKLKFSSVKVIGPNIVELKGTVDGEETTSIVSGDLFKQKYHQAIAMDQPNFFVGAIAQELVTDSQAKGLEDYLGEFEIDEEPHKAQIVDSKNFAQPHFSQHPITKSKAQTAKANWESPSKAIGSGSDSGEAKFEGMKSAGDDGVNYGHSTVTTDHFTSDQGTAGMGVDKRTPEEEQKRMENRESPDEANASAAMEPDR